MPEPTVPFWLVVFANVRIALLGRDDFSEDDKAVAAREMTRALDAGWTPFTIAKRFPLAQIAAHEAAEGAAGRGRVLLEVT